MKQLLKKFMEFAIGNGVVLIIGLISSPLITRIILPEEYGKASMFITVTSLIIVIITFGIDQAYVRYYNDEDESSRGSLLRQSIKLPLMLNLVVGGILMVFYKSLSVLIIEEVSFSIVILVIIQSIFSIISNFSMLNIRMKQKGKTYSVLTILNKVFFLISIVVLFKIYKNSYITIVLSTVISNIVMCTAAIIVCRDDWFHVEDGVKLNTTSKEMFKYGTPFIFSLAIIWVFQSIDKIALRIFSGYEQVGLYAGAMTIIALINTFQGAFTTFWTPVAYESYSKDPENKTFFIMVNEVISFVMLIISIVIIAMKDVIILFLGPEYSGAQFIFPFLVLMPIMYTISETTVMGINFTKNTKYHIYVAIISAITNIIGNLILVPRYGATGAAISTGLSYVVFFVSRTYYANKFYKVKYKLKKFAICIIAIYILAGYSSIYEFNNVIMILTIFALALVLIMYSNVFVYLKKMIKT